MSVKIMDDKTLRKCLLGSASTAEQKEFEQWLLVPEDDNYFLVEEAEDALIDDFLDKQLNRDEIERFHNYFRADPTRQRKLEFAPSFRNYIESRRREPQAAPAVAETLSFWARAGDYIGRRAVLGYAIPALIVLTIVVTSWSVARVLSLRSQLNSASARLADVAGERETSARLERQYQALEETLARIGASPSETLLAFNLRPGIVRSTSDLPTLTMNTQTQLVQFSLPLLDNNFEKYRVTLFDANAQEIWTRDNLEPRTAAQGTTIVITVPGQVFSSGEYSFNLTGLTNSQPPESINSFYFRTVRP